MVVELAHSAGAHHLCADLMAGDVPRHVLRRRVFGHLHGHAVLGVCRCAGRAVLSHESVASLNAETYVGDA